MKSLQRWYLSAALWSLVLILVQVMLLNHLRLFRYFMPLVYLYPLIRLPMRTPRWIQIILGAFAGLVVDLFMNTPGLNLASATLVLYLRDTLLRWLSEEEEDEEVYAFPSFRFMRPARYILYMTLMVLLHTSSLYLVEAFSVSLFIHIIPYILGSTAITLPIYFIFDALSAGKR